MNLIKKYITLPVSGLVWASAAMFVPTSCDDALETKMYTQLSPENFFKTEEDFNQAVVTLYNPFTTNWGTEDTGDRTWYASLYSANNTTYFMRSLLTTDELENGW